MPEARKEPAPAAATVVLSAAVRKALAPSSLVPFASVARVSGKLGCARSLLSPVADGLIMVHSS